MQLSMSDASTAADSEREDWRNSLTVGSNVQVFTRFGCPRWVAAVVISARRQNISVKFPEWERGDGDTVAIFPRSSEKLATLNAQTSAPQLTDIELAMTPRQHNDSPASTSDSLAARTTGSRRKWQSGDPAKYFSRVHGSKWHPAKVLQCSHERVRIEVQVFCEQDGRQVKKGRFIHWVAEDDISLCPPQREMQPQQLQLHGCDSVPVNPSSARMRRYKRLSTNVIQPAAIKLVNRAPQTPNKLVQPAAARRRTSLSKGRLSKTPTRSRSSRGRRVSFASAGLVNDEPASTQNYKDWGYSGDRLGAFDFPLSSAEKVRKMLAQSNCRLRKSKLQAEKLLCDHGELRRCVEHVPGVLRKVDALRRAKDDMLKAVAWRLMHGGSCKSVHERCAEGNVMPPTAWDFPLARVDKLARLVTLLTTQVESEQREVRLVSEQNAIMRGYCA